MIAWLKHLLTPDFEIVDKLIDATSMASARASVAQAIADVGKRASNHDQEVFALQHRLPLGCIAGIPAIRRIIRLLEDRIGLPCDPGKGGIQHQSPDGTYRLRWHQDSPIMGMSEKMRGRVAWIPLDPIDGRRPSLAFAKRGKQAPHHADARSFAVADVEFEKYMVIQNLDLGDVVLFSPHVFHSTYVDPLMSESRYSIDLRFLG